MRKLLAYLILGSMILHCAGRLGILDHLYQKRNSIALSLGLIGEIPIAVCGSNYDHGNNLKIEKSDDAHATMPTLAHTQEINLFIVSGYRYTSSQPTVLSAENVFESDNLYELFLVSSVFHPPAV